MSCTLPRVRPAPKSGDCHGARPLDEDSPFAHDRSLRHSYRRLGHLFFLARDWLFWIRKLQHAVFHSAVSQAHDVERVVLVELPRWARALFREACHRALYVTRGKIEPGVGAHRGIA